MTKKERMLSIYAALLGLASLSSLLTYGVTGSFWWVEIGRQDIERGMILTMLHLVMTIGGVIGTVSLVTDWLSEGDSR